MEHKGDDDGDDDVSFAKWMSSFWGHSWQEEEKGLREHHRLHGTKYRKTSLPCPFPVVSRSTAECHPRRHSEDQEFRTQAHMLYYRKCSASGSIKGSLESKGQSDPKVQEFSESFAQQLCIKTKHSVSLGPESRKHKNERERLRTEIRLHNKPDKGRSSTKEKHGEAYTDPVAEKKV
ncbi:leukemia NUP98 fusion partner 1 [Octodon degus]|uniref:Leukemia NUP98 fusion partner 1 n=1 Tax=Octodon degus TaxID=10160 RepID=A0A6P3FG23_OCTDE|nr:leukemia NUP98 fusion partner 1 [Octodon degus]